MSWIDKMRFHKGVYKRAHELKVDEHLIIVGMLVQN